MNLLEAFNIAWRSIRANALRSFLTMLGVIIGVAAVVTLMAIGQGAEDQITSQLTSTGTNLLVVVPGSTNQGGVRSATGSAATLTLEDAQAIAQPENCTTCSMVAPEYARGNVAAVYGTLNTTTRAIGVTPEYQQVRAMDMADGSWIESADVSSASNVAVLGSVAAGDLFADEDPMGKLIRINRLAFRVVGVIAPKGGIAAISPDDAIYVPITTAQHKLFGDRQAGIAGHSISTVYIQVDDQNNMTAAQQQVTDLLRQRHHITGDQNDFTIVNQADLLAALNQVVGILTAFLGAIASISLLVGGIGIMNIMLVSVTERTREIGIRKAVGARQSDILRQFVVEAVLLSGTGGLLGLLLGASAAQLVRLTGAITPSITLQSAVLAVGFSLAVGLFFGIYPARRAARLDPIEALRYE